MILYHRLTDAELVGLAQKTGDERAFTQLMARFRKPIYHAVFKRIRVPEDAEDVTLEVFGRAFTKLSKYDPTKGTFSSWLFQIAHHRSIDFVRKRRLDCVSINAPLVFGGTATFAENVPCAVHPESVLLGNEAKQLLHENIERLKPPFQSLIALRYFEELSYEEIATELNMPMGTVKSYLFRAKSDLRASIWA